MKLCTLLFLRKGDQILLAMKKRGFGVDKWNGVGGKVDAGETIEQALVRECQEEISVTPVNFWKVAVHTFHEYHNDEPADMQVHVYLCDNWQGTPQESQEMRPQWFQTDEIPYAHMWADDPYWLPQVLENKKLKTTFTLDTAGTILSHNVIQTDSLA